MRTRFQLQEPESDRMITAKECPQFLNLLEAGLLLALKERAFLDEVQCQYALEKLQKQCSKRGGRS